MSHRQMVGLTDHQRQVLELAAQGLSGQTIAITMGITLKNVKKHKLAIKRRLNLPSGTNTEEMLIRARAMGLIR